ncbi:hypothetical protein CR513_45008, partial [Mucuna pruriens]
MDDRLENMIHDIGPNDAKKPSYMGCTNFTGLLAMIVQSKGKNRWSDKSFTKLLELLKYTAKS